MLMITYVRRVRAFEGWLDRVFTSRTCASTSSPHCPLPDSHARPNALFEAISARRRVVFGEVPSPALGHGPARSSYTRAKPIYPCWRASVTLGTSVDQSQGVLRIAHPASKANDWIGLRISAVETVGNELRRLQTIETIYQM